MNQLKLKVLSVEENTSNAVTITFQKPANGFDYLSGQFLTIIRDYNGESIRRSYSFCSTPGIDEHLSVSVKRVNGGKMSNLLNDQLKAGDEVDVLDAAGKFTFEPDRFNQRHIVLVAGGSGITPLYSILKNVLHNEPQSVVSLIDANDNLQDIIYKDQIEALKNEFPDRFRLVFYLAKETVVKGKEKKSLFGLKKKLETVSEEQGYIDEAKLLTFFEELHIEPGDFTEFYLCGPGGYMEVAEKAIKKLKVDSKHIHKESFVSEAKTSSATSGSGSSHVVKVRIDNDEHEVQVEGNTILQAMLDQGIDAPYSCQSGICTSCMAKCVSGKAEMEFEDALSPDEVAEGYILTCMSRPLTDDVIIEYD